MEREEGIAVEYNGKKNRRRRKTGSENNGEEKDG